jgi:transcriptional regulator with XRE-family HTH domain
MAKTPKLTPEQETGRTELGLELGTCRRRKKLTTKEVAEKLGVGPQVVSGLEAGRIAFPREKSEKFVEVLGIPQTLIDELLVNEPIPIKQSSFEGQEIGLGALVSVVPTEKGFSLANLQLVLPDGKVLVLKDGSGTIPYSAFKWEGEEETEAEDSAAE